jgi:hypothetical protein
MAWLHPLVGTWEERAADGGAGVRVEYRLVAADSSLLETYTTRSGRQTVSVFHADGSRLLVTHYCAQGNQPRLALAGDAQPRRLRFTFVDATNLKPGASHLDLLELRPEADALVRVETYRSAAGAETTTTTLRRVR